MTAISSPSSRVHPVEILRENARKRVRYAQEQGEQQLGRSVYIIADNPSAVPNTERVLRFFREKNYSTEGCYIVGNAPTHAWKVAEMFSSLDDLYHELSAIGLENLPAILIDYGTQEIEYMVSGIEGESDPEPLMPQNDELSLDLCLKYLERIERRYLCSWKSSMLWADSGKWITVQRLEDKIQEMIEPAFSIMVPDKVTVVAQPSSVDGRADILLLPRGEGNRALYELKAIKDASGKPEELKAGKDPAKYSISYHRKEIAKGARQALSYSETYGANIIILSVFDGCKDKCESLHTSFEEPCAKRGIKLSWLRIWPTEEDMRKELIPAIEPQV